MRIRATALFFLLASSLLLLTLGSPSKTLETRAGSPSPSTYPPPPGNWTYTYGSGNAEEAHSVQPTKDGGFIVAGYTESFQENEQIWLVRTDEYGDSKWSKIYGGDKDDRAYSVQQTTDGGYIIAGCSNSFGGSNFFDAYLIKTYANASVEWSKTYNGVDSDFAWSVRQTSDGGYVVAGATVNGTDMWLFKTNALGIIEWNQTYGTPDPDEAYSVCPTSDGGYIVAGSVYHGAEIQGVLVKTTSNGTKQWSREYGSSMEFNNDFLWCVQQTVDGGYICAGRTDSIGAGGVDFWLVKTGPSGNMQWSKTYGGTEDEYAYSVIQANDTGYVLAGYTNSYGAGGFDVYVVKTYTDGDMQWSQTYGGSKGDFGTCVCQHKDMGYVVAGYTLSSGAGSSDFYMLKIPREDADGDDLFDSWEQRGVDYNGDGIIDLDLQAFGANWRHKDLFVEVDYMGSSGTHNHKPDTEAIEDVKTAFKNAPVKNLDNKDGITLHVEVDEEIPHQDVIKAWDDFKTIKEDHFGGIAQRQDANILKAMRQVYRYCLFIHQYSTNETGAWTSSTSSGLAERPGNDFIVSLGSFTGGKGNRDEQAGTFMHELGHTLGLRHGGGDLVNYKPNYLSVMNYAFQFHDPNPARPLDYSRKRLPDLNEANLDENAGVGAEVTTQAPLTIFSSKWGNDFAISSAFLPIDWNQNGKATDTNVSANINDFPIWGYPSPPGEILTGYDDWSSLVYNFRDLDNFADSAPGVQPTVDLTWETVQLIREAVKMMHDVAIMKFNTPTPVIPTGYSMNLSITLMNQGGNNETLRVTLYANATSITSLELPLERGNITTIAVTGETASLPEGNYTLRAHVVPVAGETDIADNTYDYGVLKVTATGAAWVEWSQSYPKAGEGDAYSVCQTKDGGYAIAGEANPRSYPDFLLVKTYPNGTEQWSKTYEYGQYCSQCAQSMQQTSDGGYILAGFMQTPSLRSCLWLVKTDSEGNMLWNRTYRGDPSYWGGSEWVVSQTSDGGYVAAGSRVSQPSNAGERSEMWLIKTDFEGKELWNKTYSGINWAEAYSVWQTKDGGYALGGYSDSPESIVGAALLVKTDSLGNKQWNKTYTNSRLFALQQTADGGYILTGAMYYYGQSDGCDFWLLKTDSNGSTQWNKTLDCTRWPESSPSDEEAYCIQQTSDGGYVMAGESYGEDARAWMVKTDSDGNLQADLMYDDDPDYSYTGRSIQETDDGAYVAAGYAELKHGPYTRGIFLLKFGMLMVIPEFTVWTILPSLAILTLVTIVLLKKRKQT